MADKGSSKVVTKPSQLQNKEYDIYRDSLIRYFGYANEVGEAFRPLVPRSLVNASYAVAVTYVCLDVFDKSSKTYRDKGDINQSAITAGDVFIWQMAASVIIPGFTINRITWMTGRLLHQMRIHKQYVKTVPTLVGLISIPFIVHPIDNLVDKIMDNTYRKWIR